MMRFKNSERNILSIGLKEPKCSLMTLDPILKNQKTIHLILAKLLLIFINLLNTLTKPFYLFLHFTIQTNISWQSLAKNVKNISLNYAAYLSEKPKNKKNVSNRSEER